MDPEISQSLLLLRMMPQESPDLIEACYYSFIAQTTQNK
jgi:hypothetical protein